MGQSLFVKTGLQNWRIVSAAVFSLGIIAGAYVLARGILHPPIAGASTESELLQAIATRDSDTDGLLDWEEALYGTNSQIADTNQLGMTDGEAVKRGLIVPKAIADIEVATSSPSSALPITVDGVAAPAEGTLTAAFTQSFLTLYLEAKQQKGGDLTQAELKAVADEALAAFSSAVLTAPDFKSAGDLVMGGGGSESLIAFAEKADVIFIKNTSTATTSELTYLKSILENNDPEAVAQIISIAKAYRETAVGLSALAVPQELASADLVLINALMRLSEVISDFARVNTDPLAAMLALQQYPQAVLALGNALVDVGNVYIRAGVVLPPGTPGASFANLMNDIAESQKSAAGNP